jgi:P-type Ca2+ transporter type 2C
MREPESPAPAVLPALNGLRSDQVTERRSRFGSNHLTEIQGRSFLAFVARALNDRTLKILMVSAVVVAALDLWRGQSLVEGLAIVVAVAVAAFVTSINEWRAQAQFKSLQREQHDFEVRVLRDGRLLTVSAFDLVVDDVVEIAAGDKVPADGRVFNSSELTIDESTLTGESLPVPKHQDGDALARAGTLVTEGRGTLLVTAVGDRTEYGRLRAELALDEAPTPLQERLSGFADRMSLFAVVAAVAIFAAMVLPALARGTLGAGGSIARDLLNDLVLAVTIVVVAVPEGLPVAVTLSLAWSARKLARQGCLVRRLLACETMGSVDVICTDKTGTLTFNRQRVERLRFPDGEEWSGGNALPLWSRTLLAEIASVDSTATLIENEKGRTCVGSPTEGALLELVTAIGGDWQKQRQDAQLIATFGFTSERKRMTTVVRRGDGWRVLMKGAPEIVLSKCSRSLAREGARPLRDGERAELQARTDAWGRSALRSVAFAYRDVPAGAAAPTAELENDLVFVGLAALGDPVRPEARDAITACRSAGVEVKVVTGDGRLTAEAVARDVGLVEAGDLVLEGNEFQARSDDELIGLLPKLRVVARAVPSDKLRLVELLQRAGKVVAVTGDGTNDAPALRRADVGLSMGRSGTDVAREASDIVLREDDFSAVVHALKSGRAIFDNIRKFIQFQLTVNLVAMLFSFIAGLTGFGTPLTVIQLLWVNLIMDALAALALATEPPADDLLARAPKGRGAPLISSTMWVYIGVLGAFMLGELLFGLRIAPTVATKYPESAPLIGTFLFNAFVFLQLGNLINARTTTFQTPALRGLFRSRAFLLIFFVIVVLQWTIVQFGGHAFGTVALHGVFLLILLLGSLTTITWSLFQGALVRFISRRLPAGWQERLGAGIAAAVRALAGLPAQLAQPGSEALAWTLAGLGGMALMAGIALRATEAAHHVVSYGCFSAGVLVLAIVLWQQRAKFSSRPALASPRLHAWLSAVLLLAVVGEVNAVASRHYGRLDMTARKDFTLSPQTLALLDRVNLPIRLTTIVRAGTIGNEVRDLLAEYAAHGRTVEIHTIDADSDPGEIQRLGDRLNKKRIAVDSIVVEVGERSRVLAPDEFLKFPRFFDPKTQRNYVIRDLPPEFLGEQIVTSAMLALTSADPLKVAFVVGHGERSPDDYDLHGLAILRDRLRREGCDVTTLPLVNGAPIPDDRQVVIQCGPTVPLEPKDVASLTAFLARGGKWLLTVSPFQTGGLDPLLKEWGVEIRPVYLADVEGSTAGHEPTTLMVSRPQHHPITDAMPGVVLMLPYATSVHHSPVEKKTLDADNLLLTSTHGVGVTDPRRSTSQLDPKLDKTSPTGFSVATAIAEPINFNSAEGRKEPARLVVVGNTDFATNSWVDRLGNADFLVNSVDWLARREELISLRARAPDTSSISLSINAKKALWWLVLGLLPGLAAAIGGFVAWKRRA